MIIDLIIIEMILTSEFYEMSFLLKDETGSFLSVSLQVKV